METETWLTVRHRERFLRKKKSINVLVLRFSGFLSESFCRYLIRLIRHSSFEHHPKINKYIWRINDWNFDFCLKALPLGLNSCMQSSVPTGGHRKPRPPYIPRLISWQYQILNPRSTSSVLHLDICIMDNFDSVCQYLRLIIDRPANGFLNMLVI